MADGITKLAVEGFKSIAKRQEIEIAPLTILAGANSSGKSSIMQPLLMLKQTLEATYDPGPLKIDGPNVKFTSSDEFLVRGSEAPRRLSLEIETRQFGFRVIFEKGRAQSIEVAEESLVLNGDVLTLLPDMPSQDVRGVVGKAFPFGGSAPDFEYSVTGNRFFLEAKTPGPSFAFLGGVGPIIQEVIHVPGLRGNAARTYPMAGSGPAFPGTFEHYVASTILAWQKDNSCRNDDLTADLQSINLARDVFAHRVNDVAIEIYVQLVEGRSDNIADVGVGVSQVLPVLVALRAAEPGRLVYLEEPEINLHPRAQTRLADILAGAAKRGVRVVAETHSSLLLRAVQTLVAKGDLDPDLVRLHWFTRDAAGVSQVSSTKLDANGAFGDWPEDFDDVALDSEQQYLDAVEDRIIR
jgi:hypothetical protein